MLRSSFLRMVLVGLDAIISFILSCLWQSPCLLFLNLFISMFPTYSLPIKVCRMSISSTEHSFILSFHVLLISLTVSSRTGFRLYFRSRLITELVNEFLSIKFSGWFSTNIILVSVFILILSMTSLKSTMPNPSIEMGVVIIFLLILSGAFLFSMFEFHMNL